MALRRSIIGKLMTVSLAVMILLTVCLGSSGDNGNALDAKSTYSKVMPIAGQVQQDSDFNAEPMSLNLIGIWSCDDGNKYYIRQIGNTLAWLGESSDRSRSSIAFGRISGNTVTLSWMDVPKGDSMGSGSLTISLESNDKLTLIHETGGFSGTEWTRSTTRSTYEMSDFKMAGEVPEINSSGIDLHPEFPDLFKASSSGKPSSGLERVSLNPQPEPPKPPEWFKTLAKI